MSLLLNELNEIFIEKNHGHRNARVDADLAWWNNIVGLKTKIPRRTSGKLIFMSDSDKLGYNSLFKL